MADYDLITRCKSVLSAIDRLGGDARELVIFPPANEVRVTSIEDELELRLPETFRETILLQMQGMDFAWFLPDDFELPTKFREVFAGSFSWSLDRLADLEATRNGWIREVFPDPLNDYDAVWHNKLAFHEVGNGDLLAFDLKSENREHIVYLSHDDGEGHGHRLATSFGKLLSVWSKLGFVGTEDWQWLPFWDASQNELNAGTDSAAEFRDLLGLDE